MSNLEEIAKPIASDASAINVNMKENLNMRINSNGCALMVYTIRTYIAVQINCEHKQMLKKLYGDSYVVIIH